MTTDSISGGAGHHPGPTDPKIARTARYDDHQQVIPSPRQTGCETSTPQQMLDRLRASMTPTELGIALSICRPSDQLVAAVTSGLDVCWLRWERARDVVHVRNEVGSDPSWEGWADRYRSHDQMLVRRYPPLGDKDLWVRYGDDGPPGYRTCGRAA